MRSATTPKTLETPETLNDPSASEWMDPIHRDGYQRFIRVATTSLLKLRSKRHMLQHIDFIPPSFLPSFLPFFLPSFLPSFPSFPSFPSLLSSLLPAFPPHPQPPTKNLKASENRCISETLPMPATTKNPRESPRFLEFPSIKYQSNRSGGASGSDARRLLERKRAGASGSEWKRAEASGSERKLAQATAYFRPTRPFSGRNRFSLAQKPNIKNKTNKSTTKKKIERKQERKKKEKKQRIRSSALPLFRSSALPFLLSLMPQHPPPPTLPPQSPLSSPIRSVGNHPHHIPTGIRNHSAKCNGIFRP